MGKQATVYVLDCGPSMAKYHGNSESKLEWVKRYVLDELANLVLYGRKTDQVSVVTTGDDDPEVIFDIESSSPDLLRKVQAIKPSKVEGSIDNAVVTALSNIQTFCGTKMYTKRVIVLGQRLPADRDRLEKIKEMIQRTGASILFAVVDFTTEPELDLPNTEILSYDEVSSVVYGAKPKLVAPAAEFMGYLCLGHPEGTHLALDVAVYPASKELGAHTASYVYSENLQKIRLFPESFVGGERVPDENIGVGYLYGSEIVPFDKDDIKSLKSGGPQRSASIDVIGFVHSIPPYVGLSTSHYVIPTSERGASGLSALFQSLYERDMVAVARYVRNANADIQIVSLEPHANDDFEGLLMTALPFKQDFTPFTFTPLESDKRQPTTAMDSLMEDVIDAMPYTLNPSTVPNPYNHRVVNYIKKAMVDDRISEDVLVPHGTQTEKLADLEQALDITPVLDAPKAKAQDTNLESTKGELDIDDLLA